LATAEEQVPYYSGKDTEKYRSSADAQPSGAQKSSRKSGKKDSRTTTNTKEQERWCKEATSRKKKMGKAQQAVREAEEDIAREKEKSFHTAKEKNQLQEKLAKAKTRLKAEEQELNDLENEAHRKGVPPGWLRCQFD
jgi:hypothetical protein